MLRRSCVSADRGKLANLALNNRAAVRHKVGFMSLAAKPGASVTNSTRQVLVVDDEPAMIEVLSDAVRTMDCKVITAGSIAEARRIIARETVHVMVADVNLTDGDGTTLLPLLRKTHPQAAAIVITGDPCVTKATAAIRHGAVDFVAKPFNMQQITKHVTKAIEIHAAADKTDKKIRKLKTAVRRLNTARKTISQKVDILCNDLVSAYGELSKQLDVVRTQEGFRKTIAPAKDLEQLICQSMDWMMRQTGYSNVAVWLASEEGGYQLGAYMKYTIPGDEPVSKALERVILPLAARDGRDTPVKLSAADLADKFSPAEQQLFKDQEFLAIDCTYLGESLAGLIFFRDENVPFGEQDLETLKSIAPIFASSLATIVRQSDEPEEAEPTGSEDSYNSDSNEGGTSDPKRRKPNKPDPADWWKRGEQPPF
jgi:FixJ family two-component response regulator